MEFSRYKRTEYFDISASENIVKTNCYECLSRYDVLLPVKEGKIESVEKKSSLVSCCWLNTIEVSWLNGALTNAPQPGAGLTKERKEINIVLCAYVRYIFQGIYIGSLLFG
jgi:hypothetical protein